MGCASSDLNGGGSALVVGTGHVGPGAVASMLGDAGWRVSTVPTVSEDLDPALLDDAEIVLLEGNADEEGFALCRRLQSQAGARKAALLFVLEAGSRQYCEDAVAAGAADCIARPFTAAELLARIRPHVETYRLCRALAPRAGEYRYCSYVSSAPYGVFVVATDGTHLEANPMACTLSAFSEIELLQRSHFQLLDAGTRELWRSELEALGVGEIAYIECTLQRKDGHRFDAGLRASKLPGGEYLVFCTDITQRRLAVEEGERLRTAIEQAREIILITDRDARIEYVNPAFERITGYTRAEALGRNPRFLKSGKHDRAFYEDMWGALKHGRQWTGRIVNRRKDGSLYTEEDFISPVMDKTGTIVNYVAVKHDISRELELDAQNRQVQKLEALGTLAGGIAHDFNNILASIMGFAELSLDAARSGTMPDTEHLEEIIEGGHRAKVLVSQILAFSRSSGVERVPVGVTTLVKEAVKLLRGALPSTVEIVQRYDAQSCVTMANPTQLHQIIMNLCTNAWHAMRENGGVLTIGLEAQELDPASAAGYVGIAPGPHLVLAVSDTGHGIAPEIMEKIFDPFFTTKKKNEGTGIGLSAVHSIVQEHGGAITVESEVGFGTTFRVIFPRILSSEPQKKSQAECPRGSECILVVDDEPTILRVAKGLLESLGYKVLCAESPEDALEVFLDTPEEFDLVLTDMTMPRMTGAVLGERMLARRPGTPILITTGYSELLTSEKALELGFKGLVNKPLDRYHLACVVRAALDAPPGSAPPSGD